MARDGKANTAGAFCYVTERALTTGLPSAGRVSQWLSINSHSGDGSKINDLRLRICVHELVTGKERLLVRHGVAGNDSEASIYSEAALNFTRPFGLLTRWQ